MARNSFSSSEFQCPGERYVSLPEQRIGIGEQYVLVTKRGNKNCPVFVLEINSHVNGSQNKTTKPIGNSEEKRESPVSDTFLAFGKVLSRRRFRKMMVIQTSRVPRVHSALSVHVYVVPE